MIKLYQFPRAKYISSDSPFCMKLESYFRAINIPYENQFIMDPRESPTGKIPYISDNNKLMSDSGLIIKHYEHIIEQPMQANLSALEKSTTLAYTRLLEEHLYWTIVYSRWIDPEGVKIWKEQLLAGMSVPKLAFKLMFPSVQKKVRKQLYGHGIGRHSTEQIYLFAQENLQALSMLLADKAFFFGDQPTLLDHSAYSHFASLVYLPFNSVLKDAMYSQENLVQHYERMMQLFFPEFVHQQEIK